MIRKINANDRYEFLKMAKDFYKSDAVMHPIPDKNFENTFDEVLSNSPFATSYIAEKNGNAQGYALLSFTYSNEAGGMVVWIEELFVKAEFQSKGIGSELLSYIIKKYKGRAARFRLEVEDDNIGAKKLYKRFGFEDLCYQQMYI